MGGSGKPGSARSARSALRALAGAVLAAAVLAVVALGSTNPATAAGAGGLSRAVAPIGFDAARDGLPVGRNVPAAVLPGAGVVPLAAGVRVGSRVAGTVGDRLVPAAADLRGGWSAPSARQLAPPGRASWRPPAAGGDRPRGRSPPRPGDVLT